MSEVFIGQIMMTGFGFAQKYFAFCNGQILPVAQNQALFALLGVQFGGNGTTNFALPNLQGQAPVGAGSSVDPSWQPSPYPVGQAAGVPTVTLTGQNLGQHTHGVYATNVAGGARTPNNTLLGTAGANTYGPSSGPLVPLNTNSVDVVGGNQPHQNMQPFQVINFNISLTGVWPSRN